MITTTILIHLLDFKHRLPDHVKSKKFVQLVLVTLKL